MEAAAPVGAPASGPATKPSATIAPSVDSPAGSSGGASIGTTPSASATTTAITAAPDTALPIRAIFTYPWLPENAPADGSGSRYTLSRQGLNDSKPADIGTEIQDMQYGGLDAAIFGPEQR